MLKQKSDIKLILASGSPRRKELLSGCGLTFEVIVSDVDGSNLTR
jgi:septum formation protein